MSLFGIENGIICQQVNCQNVMGAGIAKAIADAYPIVKREYNRRCSMYATQKERTEALYGHYQLVKVDDGLYVANIFSQDKYGNGPKRGIQFTNEDYLVENIRKLTQKHPDLTVYVPIGIGCGYGGGNWAVISKKIEEISGVKLFQSEALKKEGGTGYERLETEGEERGL